MPELPEVETVRRTLENLIVGKEIKDVAVHYDKVIVGDTDRFIHTVRGQKIRSIDRMGKYLILLLDRDAFVSHLRMEGKYHFLENDREPDKHEHVSFYFDDGTVLRYQDTRKFGRMELVNKESYRTEQPLKKLGPEPWQADTEAVYARIHKSSLPIKTLLLDQSILAGIGNIYANEICFLMRINPQAPGRNLSRERTAEMIKAAQEILDYAILQGGTTIHSFDANGITGRFQTKLQMHMQKICPACGETVVKEKVHGRGTYYCPVCQKQDT